MSPIFSLKVSLLRPLIVWLSIVTFPAQPDYDPPRLGN